MKRRAWKVVAAAALAGLSALALQAGASAAGGATTSTPPTAAALPFLPASETVFHPISAVRILDTRSSLGGHMGKISSGSPFILQVTGNQVPAGASAVVFNVTVIGPTAASYLTIWPSDTARPNASNISFAAGQTVANFNTVRLTFDGRLTIRPGAGSTHVLVDIAGYYSKSTAWGQSGYIGWAVASDTSVLGAHSSNGWPVELKAHNGLGDNTYRLIAANITTSSGAAAANVQVSVIGPAGSACFTAATAVPNGSGTDLEVRVVCLHTKDLTPVNATFYLQVAG